MTGGTVRGVLLVSSEETMIGLWGQLIESSSGVSLIGSAAEGSAVSEARRTRPDLVVVDADPLGVDGAMALLRKLSLVSEAALVAISSTAWPGTKETSSLLGAGADAVFPKPAGRSSLSLAGPSGASYVEKLLEIKGRGGASVLPRKSALHASVEAPGAQGAEEAAY